MGVNAKAQVESLLKAAKAANGQAIIHLAKEFKVEIDLAKGYGVSEEGITFHELHQNLASFVPFSAIAVIKTY